MKLTIRNLGRIDRATLELKPLTLFLGPNGTNKTWVASVLHGLLESVAIEQGDREKSFDVARFFEDPSHVERRFKKALAPAAAALSGKGRPAKVSVELNLDDIAGDETRCVLGSSSKKFFERVLGVPLARASANLSFTRTEFASRVKEGRLAFNPTRRSVVLETKAAYLDAPLKEVRYLGTNHSPEVLLREVAKETLWRLCPDSFFFPAERKALISARQVIAPRAESLPTSALRTFALFVSSIVSKAEPDDPIKRALDEIMGGNVRFTDREAGGNDIVLELPGGGTLPIHAASSLSRSLAGLRAYLSAHSYRDHFLIVDEVELDAHPRAQLLLAECMALLVHHGARVVVTTHSPYFVSHLNHLIAAAQLPKARQAKLKKQLGLRNTNAFLPPDQVGAYFFSEEGRISSIYDSESGRIDWETFSAVTDEMNNFYAEIASLRAS